MPEKCRMVVEVVGVGDGGWCFPYGGKESMVYLKGEWYYLLDIKSIKVVDSTLPETNIACENRPSQKEFHLQTIDFQGLC